MKWNLAAMVALAAGAATPSPAQNIPTRLTSRALADICAENDAACLTYVLGAIDGHVATRVAAGAASPFCIPATVNNLQLKDLAVRYLLSHPQEGGANAATAVVVAMRQAFPCPTR